MRPPHLLDRSSTRPPVHPRARSAAGSAWPPPTGSWPGPTTRRFEDHVAVDDLLDRTVTRAHSDTTVLETSPLLQLRRLRVLDRAARAPGTDRWAVAREPLMVAWFHAHEDVLLAYEPAGRWLLPADVYWDLFERHRDTPWAEEMAWAAARAAVPADECYAVCQLRRVSRTFARYWAAFPAGRWVPEALETTLPIFAAAGGRRVPSLGAGGGLRVDRRPPEQPRGRHGSGPGRGPRRARGRRTGLWRDGAVLASDDQKTPSVRSVVRVHPDPARAPTARVARRGPARAQHVQAHA